jgi:Flp pilus assembly protein TadD
VDADVVDHFANYRCINLVEAVRRIAGTLRALPWDVVHLSVTFSCDGGYLPINIRWVANAMVEALEGKDLSRPQAPWPTLVKVEDWRRSLLPRELVRRVRPLVLRQPADPWLRVYLSDALFRADSVSGALAEGKKAARLDPGCCRILSELGGQLAAIGRLDEAEQFLAAAPAVVNAAGELALAQGLDRAGHTAKAIEHYSRISKQAANYSTDLLIGYGYERLGDKTNARQHYLRAVALLAKPVSEMAGFADLTTSVAAAEHFLRANGYQAQAQALRRDHRLAIYFNKDTGETSGR